MTRAGQDGRSAGSALVRFAAATSGTSALEFGILAVPFLLLILGTMEYGRLMWTREALQQTAIAGARCMGMTQTSCGVNGVYSASMTQAYVIAQGGSWSIPLTADNITLENAVSCGNVSGFSRVTLSYTFTSMVPQTITALAGGANLTAVACFPNHR